MVRARRLSVLACLALVACFDWASLSTGLDASKVDAAFADYRPREGAYSYKKVDPPDAGGVIGTERFDINGMILSSVHDGVTTATVKYLDANCWQFGLALAKTHFDSFTFCGKDSKLVMPKACGRQNQAILSGQPSSVTLFTCTEGDVVLVPANDTGTLTMTGNVSNGIAFDDSGTIVVSDRNPVAVGGIMVDAIHVRIQRTQSGSGMTSDSNTYTLTGDETTELWFSSKDATILRWTRASKVTTTVTLPIFGKSTVKYAESTGYTLARLDPDPLDASTD